MSLIKETIDSLPNRFQSILIDFIILFIVTIVLSIIDEIFFISTYSENSKAILFTFQLLALIGKDLLFGQSIGKYFIGLRIISTKTGKVANPLQCVLRNVSFFLWPIELLILSWSPKRRLGDYITATKVDSDIVGIELKSWGYFKVLIAFTFALMLSYLSCKLLIQLGF
ncbi:MAG: RDD family protein [Cyclobacteriaceae bacterium]|jgi:uncharacterized RDD family membrane protein YckC|nr:RDD family protein [Flammeovirgaceae bacterium]MCZ8020633.1 RDD family protein [Cytophagales bacterium]MCZ8326908.1 RDD family protein [Cyclobacteriaceae bacterium]